VGALVDREKPILRGWACTVAVAAVLLIRDKNRSKIGTVHFGNLILLDTI
jgi:hypothetical protein